MNIVTYELQPGNCIFKDLSKELFNIHQLEYPASSSEIVFGLDEITRKTNWLKDLGL